MNNLNFLLSGLISLEMFPTDDAQRTTTAGAWAAEQSDLSYEQAGAKLQALCSLGLLRQVSHEGALCTQCRTTLWLRVVAGASALWCPACLADVPVAGLEMEPVYRLATLDESREVPSSLIAIPQAAEQLFQRMLMELHHDDAGRREWAIECLAWVDEQHVPVESIRQALFDPSARVREAAIDALAALEVRAPIEWAMALARDEQEGEQARAAAVELLGRLGGCVPTVEIARALSDASPLVRLKALEALGERGGPIGPVLDVLGDRSQSTAVRCAALGVLVPLAQRSEEWRRVARIALFVALEDDDAEVSRSAVQAVEEVGLS